MKKYREVAIVSLSSCNHQSVQVLVDVVMMRSKEALMACSFPSTLSSFHLFQDLLEDTLAAFGLTWVKEGLRIKTIEKSNNTNPFSQHWLWLLEKGIYPAPLSQDFQYILGKSGK